MEINASNNFQKTNGSQRYYAKTQNKRTHQNNPRSQNTFKPNRVNNLPLTTTSSNTISTKSPQFRPLSNSSNQWKPKKRDQSNSDTEKGVFFGKNQPYYHVQSYWDPESRDFKILDYSKPNQTLHESEVLGFKVVHNGNIIHDEMPTLGKENQVESIKKDVASFSGFTSSKFNEAPVSETISIPSFIEA